MRMWCGLTVAALVIGSTALGARVGGVAHAGAADEVSARDAFTARETARLRAHFDSVDAELRSSTPRMLRPSQRAARGQLIRWLREYRDAGRFPENDRFAEATPFFVDHRGVRCAMGELLHRAGRDDIVRDVQRTRNNAYIHELADDPRLVAWLDSVGMTVAEAGRVQPAYDGSDGNVINDVVISPSPASYRVFAGSVSVASVAMTAPNAARPSGLSKWAGLTVGVASFLTGALESNQNRSETQTWARASMFTGAVSFGVAAVRVFQPAPKPAVAGSVSRIGVVDLHPVMVPMADGRQHAGLAVRASFR